MQCLAYARTLVTHVEPDRGTAAQYGTIGRGSLNAGTATVETVSGSRGKWSPSRVRDVSGTTHCRLVTVSKHICNRSYCVFKRTGEA